MVVKTKSISIMRIITLYAVYSEASHFSCVVNENTYNRLKSLSNWGGYRRFSMDWEDDTEQPATDLNRVWDLFLGKIFPNASKEQILRLEDIF